MPLPLKAKNDEQFVVLTTDDIDINHSPSKHRYQNIIVADQDNDVLTLIETTRFDLILLSLTANCSELIIRLKSPGCINNNTPVIAIINPTTDSRTLKQYPMEFDDWLIKPITEDRLSEIIDLWRTKALASDYIHIILNKTKNNQRLALTIFEKLFEELPSQIICIKAALKNKQYDIATEITHKLNGSASFCGLTDIQHAANVLESHLIKNDYADIHRHFLTLQQHTLNFTRHQKSILADLDKYQAHKKSP